MQSRITNIPSSVTVYDAARAEGRPSETRHGFGFAHFRDFLKLTRPDCVMLFNDAVIVSNFLLEMKKQPPVLGEGVKVITYLDTVYAHQRPDLLALIDSASDHIIAFTEHWKEALRAQGVIEAHEHPHARLRRGRLSGASGAPGAEGGADGRAQPESQHPEEADGCHGDGHSGGVQEAAGCRYRLPDSGDRGGLGRAVDHRSGDVREVLAGGGGEVSVGEDPDGGEQAEDDGLAGLGPVSSGGRGSEHRPGRGRGAGAARARGDRSCRR